MPNYQKILENQPIGTSAPCRVDLGGTLDLAAFYNTLRHLQPCTFNMAIDMRTRVQLLPYRSGRVKITSRGFKPAEYPAGSAPFDHPLGLMFALAAYFDAHGIQIDIVSSSPPRSALGGSSVAAVSLVAAFIKAAQNTPLTPTLRKRIALMAHAVEESVAGVPCGRQDQLAAAFGGVNAWYWCSDVSGFVFKRRSMMDGRQIKKFRKHFLLAYCGIPHASKDINGQWVRQFLAGKFRDHWLKIVAATKKFVDALSRNNYKEAIVAMNQETALRKEMTPEVLDSVGGRLVDAALRSSCGARFTGAGGGGCIWALGSVEDIDRLRPKWKEILGQRKDASILDTGIDAKGLMYHSGGFGNPSK